MRRIVLVLAILSPLLASAQESRVQLTPTLGYNWGGDITIEERAFRQRDFEVSVDGGGAYGLRLDIPLSDALWLQLFALREETQLDDGQGLFGEDPSFIVPPGTSGILDIDITYVHAGLMWQFLHGDYQPYIAASGGIGIIDPALSLETDEGVSASFGGGLKMTISERLGLLFDVRAFWIDTDRTVSSTDHFDHIDCTGPCTYTYRYPNEIIQTSMSLGLIIKL